MKKKKKNLTHKGWNLQNHLDKIAIRRVGLVCLLLREKKLFELRISIFGKKKALNIFLKYIKRLTKTIITDKISCASKDLNNHSENGIGGPNKPKFII